MAVLAVFVPEGVPDAVRDRVRDQYPEDRSFELSRDLYLVRSDSTADSVAQNLGIKGDDQIEGAAGVVFKLNRYYSGFYLPTVWDWLSLDE